MTKTQPSRDKVIFIDRDGVINWDPIGNYIKHWKHFRFLPGVVSSLARLSQHNIRIILISNQAGIGDKQYAESALKEITLNMLKKLEMSGVTIDSVFYCLHGKLHGCECRKPKTLMFKMASDGLLYSKNKTFYIGDKATDVEAGKRFGLKTILVLTGHGKIDRARLKPDFQPDYIVPSLKEAVAIAIKQ
ncbi:MAG: HAD-IIIA family hydrolase [Candidatus Omnitrophica bacterium]|nr:HAD-IIIA family hydrolase [Candidatus Omnitrophota bacterium]